MNKFFREIAIGAEFWCDGKFWTKEDDKTAGSLSTRRAFKADDVVMVTPTEEEQQCARGAAFAWVS